MYIRKQTLFFFFSSHEMPCKNLVDFTTGKCPMFGLSWFDFRYGLKLSGTFKTNISKKVNIKKKKI